MILNVKATNKKSGEVISFALDGNADEGFAYEGTHMQEVTDSATLFFFFAKFSLIF